MRSRRFPGRPVLEESRRLQCAIECFQAVYGQANYHAIALRLPIPSSESPTVWLDRRASRLERRCSTLARKMAKGPANDLNSSARLALHRTACPTPKRPVQPCIFRRLRSDRFWLGSKLSAFGHASPKSNFAPKFAVCCNSLTKPSKEQRNQNQGDAEKPLTLQHRASAAPRKILGSPIAGGAGGPVTQILGRSAILGTRDAPQ